jgi:hypothetical protein
MRADLADAGVAGDADTCLRNTGLREAAYREYVDRDGAVAPILTASPWAPMG